MLFYDNITNRYNITNVRINNLDYVIKLSKKKLAITVNHKRDMRQQTAGGSVHQIAQVNNECDHHGHYAAQSPSCGDCVYGGMWEHANSAFTEISVYLCHGNAMTNFNFNDGVLL